MSLKILDLLTSDHIFLRIVCEPLEYVADFLNLTKLPLDQGCISKSDGYGPMAGRPVRGDAKLKKLASIAQKRLSSCVKFRSRSGPSF